MNFQEMYEKAKAGNKLRRSVWGKEEFVSMIENFMVHNRPYFPHESDVRAPVYIGDEKRYYYVVEKDDPMAQDWELI